MSLGGVMETKQAPVEIGIHAVLRFDIRRRSLLPVIHACHWIVCDFKPFITIIRGYIARPHVRVVVIRTLAYVHVLLTVELNKTSCVGDVLRAVILIRLTPLITFRYVFSDRAVYHRTQDITTQPDTRIILRPHLRLVLELTCHWQLPPGKYMIIAFRCARLVAHPNTLITTRKSVRSSGSFSLH